MAVSIGKRKRKGNEADSDADSQHEDATRALFQRAFEAKFKPLEHREAAMKKIEQEIPDQDFQVEDESEWSGLSDDEEVVETVRHDESHYIDHDTQRLERRAFMSSKPPSSARRPATFSKNIEEPSGDDASDAANLKNDLALQRLLKESHLLEPDSFKEAQPTTNSKGRLKSLDLRLKDLGAKESMSKQQKMPLSHRKGITAKATNREEKRRKDALDNGVVLEKAKHTPKAAKFREKGVGGPAIGKFKGATLKLSSRDLRSIEGVKQKRRR